MIISATLSKPAKNAESKLDKNYVKVKIYKNPSVTKSFQKEYILEFFTEKQSFTKFMNTKELDIYIEENAGITFKNAVIKTENEEIQILSNRHGEIKKLTKPLSKSNEANETSTKNFSKYNRKKNYILTEGKPINFLVKLGVMNEDGKVLNKMHDKFKQINRYLEFIDDILDDLKKLCTENKGFTKERPLYIADFGCGKSYLTFAVYYFLTEIKNIPVHITGLDLKEDVIKNCQHLAEEFGYKDLHFNTGNISDAKYAHSNDMIITLHACDTATDFALNYAIKENTKVILCVPCCQHEINLQLQKNKMEENSNLSAFCNYGILQERFSSLATDAIRAETLEENGYNVQLLEFIDMSHTPKNILIRAVYNPAKSEKAKQKAKCRKESLLQSLNVKQTLNSLLQKK